MFVSFVFMVVGELVSQHLTPLIRHWGFDYNWAKPSSQQSYKENCVCNSMKL